MENIGLSFVKLNQFTDAITAFEYIMSERPDYRTGLHLILSHYGLGDRENMKKAYLKVLSAPSLGPVWKIALIDLLSSFPAT